MAVEGRPRSHSRGGTLIQSALRFVGLESDNHRPDTPSELSVAKTKPAVPAGERYMQALPDDVEPIRAFLSTYSGIKAEDVIEHVYRMRDRLWDIYPYACVGHFRFVSLAFTADTSYQTALARLREPGGGGGARLLDVGCCVGQVLRKLAADGVDSTRLYGTDVEPRFIDVGYDLFGDRGRFKGRFIIGNLLAPGAGDRRLDALDGKMTFIHAGSFFHLFTWDDQVRAAARMVRFLDPGRPDVMLFGRHVGTIAPRDHGRAGSDQIYLHSAETWQELWDEVGARTGTRWKVTMTMGEAIETGTESALRKASFCVSRAA
ncbi:hypothetical protein GGR50DRAFT_686068 [Xylaria sp. CBS 124048]|nr:hypothetical protein GGR50DRAFT_686068 [Xylaria sp. CBS 124048]